MTWKDEKLLQINWISKKMRKPECSICHFNDEKIGFYSFPSNPARLKSWLESLKIDKKPAANAKVCFQHFDKKKIRWSRFRWNLKLLENFSKYFVKKFFGHITDIEGWKTWKGSTIVLENIVETRTTFCQIWPCFLPNLTMFAT